MLALQCPDVQGGSLLAEVTVNQHVLPTIIFFDDATGDGKSRYSLKCKCLLPATVLLKIAWQSASDLCSNKQHEHLS